MYSLRDLGDLPGGANSSNGFAINNNGDVAGTSTWGQSGTTVLTSAFRWTRTGGMQNLGALIEGNYVSSGTALNDLGVVTGSSNDSNITQRAFIAAPGQSMAPVPSQQNTVLSTGYGINNAGQVAGIVNFSQLGRRAFIWTAAGGMVTLPPVPGGSEALAYAINANGAAAGFTPMSSSARATYWAPDHTATAIGIFPGSTLNYSFAYALNDAGAVVGEAGATIAGGVHLRSFLWTSTGGLVDLGDLGDSTKDSQALGINNDGQVVGTIRVSGQPVIYNGYIWTAAQGMRNLNTLVDASAAGWIVSNATGINRYGQIVGTGYNIAGAYSHAIVLSPNTQGACCTSDGACAPGIQADCIPSGVWTSGGTCSPSLCPAITGTCCHAVDGICASTVLADCTDPDHWTIGAVCTPNPCAPLPGSCCNALSGACSISTFAACSNPSGWTLGGPCTPSPCPVPQGSCCHAFDSTCAITIFTACTSPDTWTINGVCAPDPCTAPTGVCCRGATCTTQLTGPACTVPSGVAGARFLSTVSLCNAPSSWTTPCCYADYNKTGGVNVLDIFDFLADWFTGSPMAKVGSDGSPATLTIGDIFAFLDYWFGGGC